MQFLKRLLRQRLLKSCPLTSQVATSIFNCEIEEEDEAYADSLIVVMDGNEDVLSICGVGLNDDNQIVVIDEEDEENWFVPDEWTHAYLEMYQFVVDNLAYAKQEPVLN